VRPIKKTVNLMPELLKEIETFCQKEDRNFSQLVRCAIREYLDKRGVK
jgi:metal-responsive CopG/Arc/MetJ family transcriptional regulator